MNEKQSGEWRWNGSNLSGGALYNLWRVCRRDSSPLELNMMRHLGTTFPIPKLDVAIKGNLHRSTAVSTWWYGLQPRLGWAEMAVDLPEGPSYPGHSPSFFRYAVL